MLPDTLGSGFWLELLDAIIISCKGVDFAKEKGVYKYVYMYIYMHVHSTATIIQ